MAVVLVRPADSAFVHFAEFWLVQPYAHPRSTSSTLVAERGREPIGVRRRWRFHAGWLRDAGASS